MHHIDDFNTTSPLAFLLVVVIAAVTVFLVLLMIKPRPKRLESSSPEPQVVEKSKTSKPEYLSEKDRRQQLKGKRQKRFNVKKEIRALEMEEKRKQWQEKKEEAKAERAKSKKSEGKQEHQNKQKTLRIGEEKNFGTTLVTTTKNIPRKRS